jgi:hypothetical protein
MESLTSVVIPFDDGVFFVGSLYCTDFSIGFSEIAQTLDTISGGQLLAGRRGLGEWRSLGAVAVWRRPRV